MDVVEEHLGTDKEALFSNYKISNSLSEYIGYFEIILMVEVLHVDSIINLLNQNNQMH